MLCSERREADAPFQVEYELTVSPDYTEQGTKTSNRGWNANKYPGRRDVTAALLQSTIRKNLLLSRLRFYGAARSKKRTEAACSELMPAIRGASLVHAH